MTLIKEEKLSSPHVAHGYSGRGSPMSTKDDSSEPIPFMQRLLDNPLLLLFLGVASPTIIYTLWGVMEVVSVPLAK